MMKAGLGFTLNKFLLSLTACAASAILLASPSAVSANELLARGHNCMSCHGMDRRMVGPSFKDIAQRYEKTPENIQRLATKIQRGGSGAWGPIPMPASPRVTDAEAVELTNWILDMR